MSSTDFTPSGLLTHPLLECKYLQALDSPNVEYNASAFWQKVLQGLFNDHYIYSVTAEGSPDGSLRRVDAVAKRYDHNTNKEYSMLWIEFKRKKGSVAEVEDQALDAATRVFRQENLTHVYVMTTIGTAFRTWAVVQTPDIGDLQLVPMDGTNIRGNRDYYIDAKDPAAATLFHHVQQMMTDIPVYRVMKPVPSHGPIGHRRD